MTERLRIKQESRLRVKTLTFADPVTNVCAGDNNPFRHAYFVRLKGDEVEVTDKKGRFSSFGCEVAYPGHLEPDESQRLFEPFWQAQYGPTVEPSL